MNILREHINLFEDDDLEVFHYDIIKFSKFMKSYGFFSNFEDSFKIYFLYLSDYYEIDIDHIIVFDPNSNIMRINFNKLEEAVKFIDSYYDIDTVAVPCDLIDIQNWKTLLNGLIKVRNSIGMKSLRALQTVLE